MPSSLFFDVVSIIGHAAGMLRIRQDEERD
jgi:hypothetical protein